MAENFGTRVIVPVVSRAGEHREEVHAARPRDRIAKKLVLAGQPAGWDAERILAFKVIGAVAGFVGAIVVLRLIDLSPPCRSCASRCSPSSGSSLPDAS